MDRLTLWKVLSGSAMATVLLTVLGWMALEVVRAVETNQDEIATIKADYPAKIAKLERGMLERGRSLAADVARLQGQVSSIQSLQDAFMKAMISEIPIRRPGEQHPGVGDHAE